MIYVIVGPTASGKTDTANRIAEYFNCPIINADAYQIYKDMDIGTAKIEKNDANYKRYNLLDIISPDVAYSVKQFQDDFRKCLDKLLLTNENVVIVGGNGLYLKASFYDYTFEEGNDLDTSDLDKLNNEELYEILKKLDFEATEKIHMNNRKRVIRAISIARNYDSTKSESINKQEHKMIYDENNVQFLMISPERNFLYECINKRVDIMVEKGLFDEAKTLLNKYELSLTAKAAIGYKEVFDYLDGKLSYEDTISLIKQRSRNYAKRQVTFFMHQFPTIKVFEDKNTLLKEIGVNE